MVGKTISHYQIVKKLGEGGMGVVYQPRDTRLDRFVAIKVLSARTATDLERKVRFVQEAKSASVLNHPNIITVYDIDTSGELAFIAMEYIDGKTLDGLINHVGLHLGEALRYAVQIADALVSAHSVGIIHRDIKPANIMVTEKGLVKVLDFGLAKMGMDGLSDSDSEPTATYREVPQTDEGTILGTIAYMSPEQAQGKKIDVRSDIFSFGAVLYEMVTGERAFRGETKLSTLASIINQEPKPASQIIEGLPREVERIIALCLRKDPILARLRRAAAQGHDTRVSSPSAHSINYQEYKLSDAKPDLSRLSELAGGLGLNQHQCLIYNTQEEQFAAALPFLRAGLERRERCLYIADENSAAAVLDALREAGTDVDRYVKSRALIMAGKQEMYLAHGRFDPDRMISFLSEMRREAGTGKFSGLRILGEMTWLLEKDTAPDSLIEYEAKLNHFVRDHAVRILCQYDRNRFSPELILRVIRTHPVVVYGGIICKNPYYVPPDEFLKPNQVSREVERLLNNLRTWEHSVAQLRALAARLQTVQESERKHLARELHDEIGQLLTGLRLLLRPNGELPADELKTRFEQARAVVDDLLAKVRRLSFDLRPADLDQLGLLPALLALFERYTAQTGVLVNFKHQAVEGRFASEVETGAYRVVQEALTNAARHARVSRINVRVWTGAGMLNLQIEDRGCGFDPEVVLKTPQSSGLIGMQERIMLLGGRMTIESSPGSGTTITAELPLDQIIAT
jgi:signal transduction histidine kinase/predicted Ser/Thr protein kinase